MRLKIESICRECLRERHSVCLGRVKKEVAKNVTVGDDCACLNIDHEIWRFK